MKERVGKKRGGEKRGVGKSPLHSTRLVGATQLPNSPIAEKLTPHSQPPKPSKPYRMIELDRPLPIQEQHLLRLELEQPRMYSNRRDADVRVRRVVCSGVSFGLLAGGVSFHHARWVNPHHVCGSSSHRCVDPSFLMSTPLVHRWR